MFLIDTPGWLDHWESVLKYTVIILSIYLAVLWLTIIFWTYRDIRQRSRDPIVQTAATLLVLVFFLPGLWIYQILRPRYTLVELYERSLEEEALLQELEDQKACPTCKRRVLDDYLICPSCRTQLKEACRSCSRPLSYAWMACPFCGLEKAPRETFAPRQQRPAIRATAPAPPPVRGPEPAPRTVMPLRPEHRVSRTAQAAAPAPAAPPAPAPMPAAAPVAPNIPEFSPWPAEGPAPMPEAPAAPAAQAASITETVPGPAQPPSAAAPNNDGRVRRTRDPFASTREARKDDEPQRTGPVIGTGATDMPDGSATT